MTEHRPVDEIPSIPYVPGVRLVADGEGLDEPDYEPPQFLETVPIGELVANPPPTPTTYIDGMLRAGEMCVIAAPRALGKSWFAMNLALLVARGEGYLAGMLRVRNKGRVLLCQGELSPYQSSARWGRMLGDDPSPSGLYESHSRWRVRTVRRRQQKLHGRVDEYIDADIDEGLPNSVAIQAIDVLIIDPWRVFFGGAESSNDEVEAALDRLRTMTLDHGVALVLIHHVGKTTEYREPEDLWRGASRLADWASTRVTLMPHYTDKEIRERKMSRHQARRYIDIRFLTRAEPIEDFSAHWNDSNGWWERWLPPEVTNPDVPPEYR